jgi:hypothetical protein
MVLAFAGLSTINKFFAIPLSACGGLIVFC